MHGSKKQKTIAPSEVIPEMVAGGAKSGGPSRCDTDVPYQDGKANMVITEGTDMNENRVMQECLNLNEAPILG
jgi:hypothetical protein